MQTQDKSCSTASRINIFLCSFLSPTPAPFMTKKRVWRRIACNFLCRTPVGLRCSDLTLGVASPALLLLSKKRTPHDHRQKMRSHKERTLIAAQLHSCPPPLPLFSHHERMEWVHTTALPLHPPSFPFWRHTRCEDLILCRHSSARGRTKIWAATPSVGRHDELCVQSAPQKIH